jgi:predicted TPR repeat methyltransferase
LTAFLAQRPGAYDLIAAADVLCYFGSLEQVLGKASLALRPQGLIAFTVEAAEQGAFTLQATGRYAHAEAYLRACLEGAGLSLLELKQDHARTEAGKPVPCFAVAAERRTD